MNSAKQNRLIFIWILAAAVLCSPGAKSAETILPPLKDRKPAGEATHIILVQPFKDTKIKINGEERKPVLVSSDKTLGTLKVTVPVFEDKLGSQIELEAAGYANIKAVLPHVPAPERIFIFDKADSGHRFTSYHKTGRQPKSIAFLDNERMIVPLLEDDGIDIIHVTKGLIKRIAPSPADAKLLGFVEPLVIPASNEVWVSQMTTNKVHIFSLDKLDFKESITLPGKWTKVLTLDPTRKVVYASNWASQSISVIDIATRKVTGQLPTGGVPRGMLVTPDGKFIYAAQFAAGKDDTDGRGRLLKLELPGGKLLGTYGVPGSKRHLAYTAKSNRVFLSDMAHGHVEVYEHDKELPPVKVYEKPNTIVLSSDERTLYVSCRGPNNPKSYLIKGFEMGRIYAVDTDTMKVKEWWEGGNQPTGLAVSPDGRYVASSDFLDFAIRVYEILPPPK